MIAVLYHANCADGFAAAWSASKVIGTKEVMYIPVSYGKEIPPVAFTADSVYILDFSYPAEDLLSLCRGRKVIVMDHHESAQIALADLRHENLEIIFDMERSGAGIAWDCFNRGAPRPSLIDHIEDRDLWRFKLPNTKEICAALSTYSNNFKVWDLMDIETLRSEGIAINRMRERMVESICAKPWLISIAGFFVPVVNTSVLWSEVCHHLIEKYPGAQFVACFTEHGGDSKWSLRCSPGFNVAEIAQQFGGGGHRHAAGFTLNNSKLHHSDIDSK